MPLARAPGFRGAAMVHATTTKAVFRTGVLWQDAPFNTLRAAVRWPAVYIDDMQKVLDHYEPA